MKKNITEKQLRSLIYDETKKMLNEGFFGMDDLEIPGIHGEGSGTRIGDIMSDMEDRKEEALDGIREFAQDKMKELIDELISQYGDEIVGEYSFDIKKILEEKLDEILG